MRLGTGTYFLSYCDIGIIGIDTESMVIALLVNYLG